MVKNQNPITFLLAQIEEQDLFEKEIHLKRYEFLKNSGTIDTRLYYIQEGSLRIFVSDEQEEKTIRFGYKGNFIASLDSFISEKPSNFLIQALKKTTVKVISKETYMALIHSSNELQQAWNNLLEQLVLQQMEREIDLLTTSPIERYKRVLLRSPQLFQEIPNKYIADYLRMTPETLSRIKKS